jgi:hypothetical protein
MPPAPAALAPRAEAVGIEIKLTDRELPVSPQMIEFLDRHLAGEPQQASWPDQLSEALVPVESERRLQYAQSVATSASAAGRGRENSRSSTGARGTPSGRRKRCRRSLASRRCGSRSGSSSPWTRSWKGGDSLPRLSPPRPLRGHPSSRQEGRTTPALCATPPRGRRGGPPRRFAPPLLAAGGEDHPGALRHPSSRQEGRTTPALCATPPHRGGEGFRSSLLPSLIRRGRAQRGVVS